VIARDHPRRTPRHRDTTSVWVRSCQCLRRIGHPPV